MNLTYYLEGDSGSPSPSSSSCSGEGGGALLELGGDAIDVFPVPVLGGDGRERRLLFVVPPGFPRRLRAVVVGRGAGAVIGVVCVVPIHENEEACLLELEFGT